MLYQLENKELESVWLVSSGKVNDIVVCKETNTASAKYYTLLIVKDHQVVKRFLSIYTKAGDSCKNSLVEVFATGGVFYIVYMFQQERRLEQFFLEKIYSFADCEKMARKIIVACLESKLPYPLLYLAFTQKQVHLSEDRHIYFGFQFHLEELDEKKGEPECVRACVSYIIGLMERKRKYLQPFPISLKLLQQKEQRNTYQTFEELYKDLCITGFPHKKVIEKWVKKYQGMLCHVILVFSTIMGILALAMAVFQILTGDNLFMWFLDNSFQQIGTESLLQ